MSFVRGRLDPKRAKNRYATLGYEENPFPARGAISSVYQERPELEDLRSDLAAFLAGRSEGGFWALRGEQGIGKSNFLHYVDAEIAGMVADGELKQTAYLLLTSNQLTPGRFGEALLRAIGGDRIGRLLEQRPTAPENITGTDLATFFDGARSGPDAVAFLLRWLGGQQTYKAERTRYGIVARERLPPAITLPYLRTVVDMLDQAKILSRIVLLLDEFEDVQLLEQRKQTEYVQTLKTLVNVFNWKSLYVIVAGAPAAFNAIAEKLPSLASRWRLASLRAVETADAAVALANAHKKAAALGAAANKLWPSELEIKAAYVDLAGKPGNAGKITQRELLGALHDQLERLADEGTARRLR